MHAHVPRGPTNGHDSVHGCVRGGRFLGRLHWEVHEFDTGNGQLMCLQRTERGLVRAPTTERGLVRAPTSQRALLPQATDRTRELVGRWPRPHAFRACRRQFLGGRPRRAHVASAPPSGVRGVAAENFAAIQGGGGGGYRARAGLGSTLFFDGWLGGCCTPTFLAGQRMGTTAFTDVFAVAEFWATCTGQVMSLTPETGK